ncbi:Digeranylgeranylglyceryl phosphate synthase [uncultured archaeon]|nr:Digeranylgeranylglyceryl phosphate synthase [uncultured archaeon]
MATLAAKFKSYMKLFRIEHAFLLSFAVLLSELILWKAGFALPTIDVIAVSLAVPFLIEMGSFALNDYLDLRTDEENSRTDRPLVTDELDPIEALAAAAACYLLGILIAIDLPIKAFAIAASFAILSVGYNQRLKDLPVLGNFYIGCSMAIPFLFANVIMAESLYPPVLAIAAVAFVSGFGREIIKSIQDVEGDVKQRGSKTLPAVIGKKNSAYFAAICYFALVPLSLLPFAAGLPANLASVGLTAVAAVSFAAMGVSVLRDMGKENMKALRKTSLITVAVGLAGYAASLI